jgi:hypothetical protein
MTNTIDTHEPNSLTLADIKELVREQRYAAEDEANRDGWKFTRSRGLDLVACDANGVRLPEPCEPLWSWDGTLRQLRDFIVATGAKSVSIQGGFDGSDDFAFEDYCPLISEFEYTVRVEWLKSTRAPKKKSALMRDVVRERVDLKSAYDGRTYQRDQWKHGDDIVLSWEPGEAHMVDAFRLLGLDYYADRPDPKAPKWITADIVWPLRQSLRESQNFQLGVLDFTPGNRRITPKELREWMQYARLMDRCHHGAHTF